MAIAINATAPEVDLVRMESEIGTPDRSEVSRFTKTEPRTIAEVRRTLEDLEQHNRAVLKSVRDALSRMVG